LELAFYNCTCLRWWQKFCQCVTKKIKWALFLISLCHSFAWFDALRNTFCRCNFAHLGHSLGSPFRKLLDGHIILSTTKKPDFVSDLTKRSICIECLQNSSRKI
jgi:hypothetical protein